MTAEGPEKKSETIKVRVPWTLKRAFLARARAEGRSASALFREFMEEFVRRPVRRPQPRTLETAMTAVRNHPRPAFAAAAVAGAAGISALLTSAPPAGAAADLRAQFERLDADGDGVVTLEEMSAVGGGQATTVRIERGADGTGVATVERDGEVRTFGLPDPDVEIPEPRAGVEAVGPILLPVTTPEGELRTMMMYSVQRFDGEDLTMDASPPRPLLDEFLTGDADGDNALSFAEFEERYIAMRAKSFAILDADGNGYIGGEEMTANPIGGPDGEQIARSLRAVDADGDGRVTRSEYEAAL